MQKKIIALAVAGLMSGAAFAQSNVQIYGIADVGYRHDSSHITAGVDSKNSMTAGQQSASRLGFKGTEDLGGGLKAGFIYEIGFTPDEGDITVTNIRTSVLNLSGKFGTLQMGRQLTPQNIIQGSVDPFATTGVGSMTNLYATVARLDNTFAYVSPTFSGLTGVAAYTWNGVGAESNGNIGAVNLAAAGGTPNAKVWALAALYNNGPIFAAFNYHRAALNDTGANVATADGFRTSTWDLAGAYDFGVAKISGMYGKINTSSDLEAATGVDNAKQWMLAVSAPLGNGKVYGSYTRATWDVGGNDPKGSQWAIGYDYNLSKRTNFYAKYGKINYNTAGETAVRAISATAAEASDFALGMDSTFQSYRSSLAVGLRHTF